MNIVVISAFRNASHYLPRYFKQIDELQKHIGKGHNVRVIAVEGDSTDDTYAKLNAYDQDFGGHFDVTVCTHNHGGPVFGSTESPDRLKALTGVMMTGMMAVNINYDDIVLYVESDLIWEPDQIVSLIAAYNEDNYFDIVAPLVFAGENFYDVFAYRKNGERFSPFYPYHSELNHNKDRITEVDSVGSCLLFNSFLAMEVIPIGEEGLISWCAGARKLGYKIGIAPGFRVEHPV